MGTAKECQVRHEARAEVDILHLEGAMDAYSFPRLEAALNNLRSSKRHRVVLECSGLEFINSAALGALIGYARRAREQGGDLKLAALTPKIASIVELLGFDRILQTFGDEKLAVENFGHS
jgi:anti-sigma B factor antagonist